MLRADFFSWSWRHVTFSFRETCILIFLLVQLTLLMELVVYCCFHGTCCVLIFSVKLVTCWFFLLETSMGFFSSWNWFCLLNLLRAELCSWNLQRTVFFVRETNFVHGASCVSKLFVGLVACIFLFLKLLTCWFSHHKTCTLIFLLS